MPARQRRSIYMGRRGVETVKTASALWKLQGVYDRMAYAGYKFLQPTRDQF